MRKEFFANEGGVNGAGIGGVDTVSEDFQKMLATIREDASKRTPQQRSELHLSGIRFHMECYLSVTGLPDPDDISTLLSKCIEAIEVKNKDFAAYIGIESSNLSAILKGRRRISPAFALKLEQIFGISATLWLSVQSKNELEALRNERAAKTPALSLADLLAKAAQPKPLRKITSIKNEPIRKAVGQ